MKIWATAATVALLVCVPPLATPSAGLASQARPRCTAIAHVGDSLTSSVAGGLRTAYRALGWRDARIDARGGRAIIEAMRGDVNGLTAVARLRQSGFHGCWVVALGTNDTANVAAGASLGRRARIERLLRAIGNEPVLWVDVALDNSGGHYTRAAAGAFNGALAAAASSHPNVHVFTWSKVVQHKWFSNDGVHYTKTGYQHFKAAVAAAAKASFRVAA